MPRIIPPILRNFFDLIEYLEKNLRGAVNGTVVFSNPVSDFLDKNRIQLKSYLFQMTIRWRFLKGEKGFLDFLADIEEDTSQMNDEITAISAGMETMSSGINECTEEINRVQKKWRAMVGGGW